MNLKQVAEQQVASGWLFSAAGEWDDKREMSKYVRQVN